MTEEVFVRFSDPRLLVKYTSKLEGSEAPDSEYRKSKRNPNLLTIKTKNLLELETSIKQIDEKAKVYKNTTFETF